MSDKNTRNEDTVHVGLSGRLDLPLSPENISSIPLYQIHINLWGTILSKDPSEALSTITHVSADEKVYQFKLKSEAKFSNGRKITSSDVIGSLQRVISIQHEGHFNARNIIDSIEKISDEEFAIHLKEVTPSFLFLLTIPELGIVPNEILDANGKIQNLEITSGAYSVSRIEDQYTLLLTENPYFIGRRSDAPKKVRVHFYEDIVTLFAKMEEGLLDFVELYDSSSLKKISEVKGQQSFSDYRLISTRPSYSFYLSTNTLILGEKERQALSSLIQRNLNYNLIAGLEKRSYELLPPKSFGALNITSAPAFQPDTHLPKEIKMIKTTSPLNQAVGSTLENAGIKVTWLDPKNRDKADILLRGQGMNADYPEIELHLMLLSPWAILEASQEEKQALTEAMHENDEARHSTIQRIQSSLLYDGRAIPLLVRSYIHGFKASSLANPNHAEYDGDVRFYQMTLR